jgi:hypothetical protein
MLPTGVSDVLAGPGMVFDTWSYVVLRIGMLAFVLVLAGVVLWAVVKLAKED